MVSTYTPIFILILFAIFGIAAAMVAMSAVLGPRRRTAVKQMPYESGMDPIGDARQRFDVRYYLVAILFLLFDVELLYLYPWATAQWAAGDAVSAPLEPIALAPAATSIPTPDVSTFLTSPMGIPAGARGLVFVEILVFIAVLLAAYIYAWRKGVFAWR
ncbi:MAG: NADH-quinone oxidoreductase subunit A [Isosphaeraceae bacterium]